MSTSIAFNPYSVHSSQSSNAASIQVANIHTGSHASCLPPSQDTYTANKVLRFGRKQSVQSLRNDPVFKANGLTPHIATTEADLLQIAKMHSRFLQEAPSYTIQNMCLSLSRRTDQELIQYFKAWLPKNTFPPEITIEDVFPQLKAIFTDPEQLRKIIPSAENEDVRHEIPIFKQRFIDNPHGAMIVLKNRKGEIVACEGINQLQKTHDFHIDQGIHDALDLKHGLATALYVKPEYRGRGIGTALKKTIIAYGKDSLGYRYIHAPTEKENSSHRINRKLGYQPWTKETQFKDSPVFTPEMRAKLMDEYNIGSIQLDWLDTHSEAIRQMLEPVKKNRFILISLLAGIPALLLLGTFLLNRFNQEFFRKILGRFKQLPQGTPIQQGNQSNRQNQPAVIIPPFQAANLKQLPQQSKLAEYRQSNRNWN